MSAHEPGEAVLRLGLNLDLARHEPNDRDRRNPARSRPEGGPSQAPPEPLSGAAKNCLPGVESKVVRAPQ